MVEWPPLTHTGHHHLLPSACSKFLTSSLVQFSLSSLQFALCTLSLFYTFLFFDVFAHHQERPFIANRPNQIWSLRRLRSRATAEAALKMANMNSSSPWSISGCHRANHHRSNRQVQWNANWQIKLESQRSTVQTEPNCCRSVCLLSVILFCNS